MYHERTSDLSLLSIENKKLKNKKFVFYYVHDAFKKATRQTCVIQSVRYSDKHD